MEKVLIIYLVAVNILTLLVYGVDKLKAIGGRWRISEAMLVGLAVIGGAYGAIVGMYLFHHKTKKAKFFLTIPCLCIIYTAILYFILLQ